MKFKLLTCSVCPYLPIKPTAPAIPAQAHSCPRSFTKAVPTYLTVSEATQSLGSSRIPGDWSPKAAPASHLRSPLLLSRPVSITGSLCTSQPRPRHSGPIPGSHLPQPSACNPSLNLGSDHFPHPLATTGTSRLDYGS